MEIKIKTVEEFHADNVTIEIRADRVEPVKVVESAVEIKWLQDQLVGNAGTITALEEKVAELEAELAAKQQRLAGIAAERDTAQQARETETRRANAMQEERDQVDRDRVIETKRANDLHAEVRRLAQVVSERFTRDQVQAAKQDARADERASWERRLAAERHIRQNAEVRLGSIRESVNRPGVDTLLEGHEELGRIIAYVRDVVDPTDT